MKGARRLNVTDAISQLQDAQAKAAAKVKRLRTQLENAEIDLAELDTALRVLERISGDKPVGPAAAQSENGQLIWSFVGIGKAAAKPPKEIIEELKGAGHDLGADLIRTQLWRMAKRGELNSDDGLYWRPAGSGEGAEEEDDDDDGHMEPNPPLPAAADEWQGVGRTNPYGDLDDEIPF